MMSKRDSLVIAKFKLYQIVTDSHLAQFAPELHQSCFNTMADLEKEIIKLTPPDISEPDEDKHKPTRDRVQGAILPVPSCQESN